MIKPLIPAIMLAAAILCAAAEPEIKTSPDGNYGASVEDDSSEQQESVLIFAIPSKAPLHTAGTLSAVDMKWSKNSKNLLIFDHLAGGSYLKIITRIDDKWTTIDCEPPLDEIKGFVRYGVVSVTDLDDHFRVKYLVSSRDDGNDYHYLVEYDLSMPSNKISNYKKTRIPPEDRASIKTIGQK
jgi:hypothetical protein